MTSKALIRKIPWKIALPTIAVLLELWLWHLDRLWAIGAAKWDDTAVTSAQGLSVLLNGPVAEFLRWWTPTGLVYISIFWAGVGWLTDRRLAGNRTAAVGPRWLGRSLCAVGFALGALLLFHAVSEVLLNRCYPYLLDRAFWESPHAHLLGRELTTLAEVIWGLICVMYFGKSLLSLTLKRTLGAAD